MHAEEVREDPDVFMMFTVYKSPRDYPGSFVVRRWRVRKGQVEAEKELWCPPVPTLALARKTMPAGYAVLARHPSDDPTIAETWI
jgi:hypothetical protein